MGLRALSIEHNLINSLYFSQANALMAGQMYVNIHTAANKAGEIRGQVMK